MIVHWGLHWGLLHVDSLPPKFFFVWKVRGAWVALWMLAGPSLSLVRAHACQFATTLAAFSPDML